MNIQTRLMTVSLFFSFSCVFIIVSLLFFLYIFPILNRLYNQHFSFFCFRFHRNICTTSAASSLQDSRFVYRRPSLSLLSHRQYNFCQSSWENSQTSGSQSKIYLQSAAPLVDNIFKSFSYISNHSYVLLLFPLQTNSSIMLVNYRCIVCLS